MLSIICLVKNKKNKGLLDSISDIFCDDMYVCKWALVRPRKGP